MALAVGNNEIVEQFLKSLSNDSTNVTKSSKSENPLKNYRSGQVSTSDLRPFTLYWDTHLKKLDINFKLTIFNDRWIELDHMVEGNNTSSKKKDKPTGQMAKSEWWMTYADWMRAKSLMLKYLRDAYDHKPFAADLEKHFEYVESLSLRHGWITAFRYDIMVRTDVLCNRINGAPGDPSVQREIFLEEAKARSALLQDGRITLLDNRTHSNHNIFMLLHATKNLTKCSIVLAYAKGNVKERFNPITGKRYQNNVNHDSIDGDISTDQEQNNYLKPQFDRENFKRNENYQPNNRRNARGRHFRSDRSPGPYQRFEKPKDSQDEKGKGKNVEATHPYKRDDNPPRQSGSKDKQS